jgi:transcriptional regulator with XRE-family HTH domain/tetratricopeptide (TPR) repeat protein
VVDGHRLGGLLRQYRTETRLTQEELAERAQVSSRTIRDIERGAVKGPRKSSAHAIAEALNLPPQEREHFLQAAHSARWAPGQADPDDVPAATHPAPPDLLSNAPASLLVPHELPAKTSFFVGRTQELIALDKLLDGTVAGGTTIAIVGTAGVGKSALAVHWAHGLSDRFPDGQLFVNLRGYDMERQMRPVEALGGFLRSLGIPRERVPIDEREAANMYRSLLASKRMLVVLDNARSPEQVRSLLPGSDTCLTVVTSRHALGGLLASDGAQRLVLSILPASDAVTLVSQMVGSRRVDAEPEAVSELMQLCSFMPLSLRIAGANLAARPHRPVADYVAALNKGDSLEEFAIDGDRHSTIRTVFDQSYAALPPDEQRLFRLTSFAPGPDVTADAAAAMSGESPANADRMLRGLAAAHMLNEHDFGRYSFHDVLRTYGRARARNVGDDIPAALARLFDWYLATTISAADQLYPERIRLPSTGHTATVSGMTLPDRARAHAWLDAETLNLAAAVHHAAEQGPAAISWRLVDTLRAYFWENSPGAEWLGCAHAALDAARAVRAADGTAAASLAIAQLLLHQGHHKESVLTYETSLEAMRRAGWQVGEVVTLCHLGTVHLHSGSLREAIECQQEALDISRASGLANGEAFALHGLGRAVTLTGDLDRAESLLRQARTGFAAMGDRYGEAHVAIDLSILHREADQHQQALDMIRVAMELASGLGQTVLEARCHSALASVHHRVGRLRDALTGFETGLRLSTSIGSKVHEAECTVGLAAVHCALDDLPSARRLAAHALELCRAAGYRLLEAEASEVLAEVALRGEDAATADSRLRHALALHREAGCRTGERRVLEVGRPTSEFGYLP